MYIFLCLSLVNYSLVSALFSLSPIIMSKHQGPTHSFFSKRPRVATGSSDAINDFQVAIVDPKSVPNDISKTARKSSLIMKSYCEGRVYIMRL